MDDATSHHHENMHRRSPTMYKGLHSVRKRRPRISSPSLHLSYTELLSQKDFRSSMETASQPFAGLPPHWKEPADVPTSPCSTSTESLLSDSTSPTTPRFSKEVEQPLVIECPDLDALSISHHRRVKSHLSVSLASSSISSSSSNSPDSSSSEEPRAPRSASPRRNSFQEQQTERKPVRRRRDSDGALEVAMFHQRLGRRDNTRTRPPVRLTFTRPRVNTIPPAKVDVPMVPSAVQVGACASQSTLVSSCPSSMLSGGQELSKPLPPHPPIADEPPCIPCPFQSDAQRKTDLHVQLPIVPVNNASVPKIQTQFIQRVGEISPSSRTHSPSSSISFTLSRFRLRKMASRAAFATRTAPESSIQLSDPDHGPLSESFDYQKNVIKEELLTSPASVAHYGGDDWDSSGLRPGTPMPRFARDVSDSHRVKVTFVRGNTEEERDVLEILPALRMLKDGTKSGRA